MRLSSVSALQPEYLLSSALTADTRQLFIMSTIHQTALKVIDAYNSWDIEKMMAVRAPECIQEMRPGTRDDLLQPPDPPIHTDTLQPLLGLPR